MPSTAGTGKSKGIGIITPALGRQSDNVNFYPTTNRISSIAGPVVDLFRSVNAEMHDGKFGVAFYGFRLYKTQIFACKEGGLIAGPGVGFNYLRSPR